MSPLLFSGQVLQRAGWTQEGHVAGAGAVVPASRDAGGGAGPLVPGTWT